MSAELKTITELPKEIASKVKSEAKPATKDGIVSQAVGFAIGIPVSMLYDWLYEQIAEKAITNEIARDILKVAMPLGFGVAVHVSKVPFGNYIAGTGYAVALISLGKIVYNRVKGLLGYESGKAGVLPLNIHKAMPPMDDFEAFDQIWGVQD